MRIWVPHKLGLTYLHDLPAEVDIEVADDPAALPSDPETVTFFVPTLLDQPQFHDVVPRMSALEVLQLPSAGSDGWLHLAPPTTVICDARGLHSAATAEWVLAATLAQLRHLPSLHSAQLNGVWNPQPGVDLSGRRVLLIGAGSVGTAVARRLEPFEVDLTVVARTARPAEGVRGVADLPLLLPRADVVIVVVPLTAATRHLVDSEFLAALPDGALLVNASRGPVVDTTALLGELSSGRLRAALDVTDPEPLPDGHPLWREANALITPHVGAITEGLTDRVYRLVRDQVDSYLAGEPLANRVDR
ncbi:2-hydroxyacid dehydrogenase [Micromonospora taraxaci]|uniref:2-hydroxyacid dehydrogenase n=1 Tax=Micromonospora taraxaci TaxID=1316803 RepID=UPI003C306794